MRLETAASEAGADVVTASIVIALFFAALGCLSLGTARADLWRHLRYPFAAAVCFALSALCMVDVARAQSGQHGDGHAEMHGVYKEWRQPSNPAVSCCNDADCRPTRAYVGEDGLWRAWNGLKWLTIPAAKVLPTDLAGDGRNHLCELDEYVYCFSPAGPRS